MNRYIVFLFLASLCAVETNHATHHESKVESPSVKALSWRTELLIYGTTRVEEFERKEVKALLADKSLGTTSDDWHSAIVQCNELFLDAQVIERITMDAGLSVRPADWPAYIRFHEAMQHFREKWDQVTNVMSLRNLP